MINFFKSNKYAVHIFIISLLLLTYFSFRLYNHQERVNFAEDQGIILTETFNIWKNKEIKLIGSKVSHGYEGRFFFHGPYVYYFLLPGMLIANWNPIGGSIITIFWNMLGVILLYLIGVKSGSKLLGILLSLIYSASPFLILYTSFVWNPNFLPLLSIIISYLILFTNKKNISENVFAFGLLLGVGLLLHYQMILIFPVIAVYLLYKKFLNLENIFFFITGLFIGLVPMILFELKHDFYNYKTARFVMAHLESGSVGLPLFYFLVPIMVLTILSIVYLYKMISKKYKKYFLVLMSIIMIFTLLLGINDMFQVPKDLTLLEVKEISKIIHEEQPKNFNVVNLTSGNTRFNALRYYLLYTGLEPLGVESYPNAESLFVVSDKTDITEIEQASVWEISSYKGEVVKEWKLSSRSKYYLYWLKKAN